MSTTLTGTGAGALGAAKQQIPAGVTGGIALAGGLITTLLVSIPMQRAAEERQKEALKRWDEVLAAMGKYETDPSTANTAAFRELLTRCAGDAPPQATN